MPERSANIWGRTQQLTRYVDDECLDLEKDQHKAKEHAQPITIRAATGNGGGGSTAE